jgi:hypothetical protein
VVQPGEYLPLVAEASQGFGAGDRVLSSVVLALAPMPLARADTLHVAADAQTTSSPPTLKLGLLPAMAVRQAASGPVYNSYVRFELATLPDDPTVQKAVLRLWVLGVLAPGTIEVVTVVAPWQESTVTAETSPALGTPVASFSVTGGDALHFVDVDVTGVVQDWSRGLLDNHGLALRGSGAVSVILDTKESILHSHAPELEVVLADAGPPGSQGLPGEPGMKGDTGATGAPGVAGAPGSSCWDSNMNLACDAPTEDVTGDGACTVADCRGPQPPFFGQSCPAGQFVSGFGASGQLLCADPSAPPLVITSRALSLDQANLPWYGETPSGTFSEKASFAGQPGIGHPNFATVSTGGPLVVVVTGLHGHNPQPIRVALLDSHKVLAQNGGVFPGTPALMASALAACPGCVLADLEASPPQVWKITGIAAGIEVTVLVGAEGVLDDPPVVPRPGQAMVANFGQFSDQFQALVP